MTYMPSPPLQFKIGKRRRGRINGDVLLLCRRVNECSPNEKRFFVDTRGKGTSVELRITKIQLVGKCNLI